MRFLERSGVTYNLLLIVKERLDIVKNSYVFAFDSN